MQTPCVKGSAARSACTFVVRPRPTRSRRTAGTLWWAMSDERGVALAGGPSCASEAAPAIRTAQSADDQATSAPGPGQTHAQARMAGVYLPHGARGARATIDGWWQHADLIVNRLVGSNMQHTTCDVRHATFKNVASSTVIVSPIAWSEATCSIQHGMCNTQHTTWDVQRATLKNVASSTIIGSDRQSPGRKPSPLNPAVPVGAASIASRTNALRRALLPHTGPSPGANVGGASPAARCSGALNTPCVCFVHGAQVCTARHGVQGQAQSRTVRVRESTGKGTSPMRLHQREHAIARSKSLWCTRVRMRTRLRIRARVRAHTGAVQRRTFGRSTSDWELAPKTLCDDARLVE